ncbi:MAG: bifunctional phosphopantothenoylcysteine decarboxylase/phosphopantothenate--cysteine ligase CoaBC [Mogibacterium sp.]|nr:bifunctional phosphopantothenoylcysteine decarboxylase/phosphopantothenate--cysteine ligase CoaBC [Mogibacterium sp.]
MDNKKTVLLGISGGISAYKSVYVASGLKKKGYDVRVVMTENAAKFVTPLTFETMSCGKVVTDVFDPRNDTPTEHIKLGHAADLILIAPATANTIAKLAHGIADNMLTTTALAATCPKLISPAMNTDMFENPATQDNLNILRDYGFDIIEPAYGMLACGVEGKGKMPEPDVLISYVEQWISKPKDMKGLKVLVTAGPTEEAVDPVRYITNHSSGKMGYALARMAARRGAEVTLVSGRTALPREPFVETVDVLSAEDMFKAVTERAPEMDVVIKAAAVADFTPANPASEKIKKADLAVSSTGMDGGRDMSIKLAPTKDILKYLGEHRRPGQFLCGFAMETQNLMENASAKLAKKNVDMICANSLRTKGAGFAGDTNVVTMITKDGIKELPLMSKTDAADAILDEIMLHVK